jgi:hypothetical protein
MTEGSEFVSGPEPTGKKLDKRAMSAHAGVRASARSSAPPSRLEAHIMALLLAISTWANPESFVSQHWLHTRTGDGRELIVQSGNALVSLDYPGFHEAGDWRRGEVGLEVELGPGILPQNKFLRVRQYVVVVNPSSTWTPPQAGDSGFAVDAFRLLDWDAEGGLNFVRIVADVGVVGGWLYRLSYHFTLLGEFVDGPRVS